MTRPDEVVVRAPDTRAKWYAREAIRQLIENEPSAAIAALVEAGHLVKVGDVYYRGRGQ